MTVSATTRSLVIGLIGDIIADKRYRHIHPPYAMITEIRAAIDTAITDLLAEGTIVRHLASVNRIPAYLFTEKNNEES